MPVHHKPLENRLGLSAMINRKVTIQTVFATLMTGRAKRPKFMLANQMKKLVSWEGMSKERVVQTFPSILWQARLAAA